MNDPLTSHRESVKNKKVGEYPIYLLLLHAKRLLTITASMREKSASVASSNIKLFNGLFGNSRISLYQRPLRKPPLLKLHSHSI